MNRMLAEYALDQKKSLIQINSYYSLTQAQYALDLLQLNNK